MSDLNNLKHIIIDYSNELDNYAVISINRPRVLNAITVQTLKEISTVLEDLELNSKIRCVVLRGGTEGIKKPAFSVGADLSSPLDPRFKMNVPVHMMQAMDQFHKYFDLIEEFSKPLIAAVDGYALGGGCELALVCDIIIATKRSQFGFPEIKRGIFPAGGGTQRMARYIGIGRAAKMLYFGERFSAEQLYQWGFLSFLEEEETFEQSVHEKAKLLGSAPTTALMVIKRSLKFGSQVPLKVGLQFEKLGFGVNSGSSDVQEGIKAFLKKEEPNFKGF